MIFSNIKYSERIEPLHPLFKPLFDYVKTHDLLHTECGRIEIEGDNLYINLCTPTCMEKTEQVMEVHADYIDVHILLEGHEAIGCSMIHEVKNLVKPYDAESECSLYSDISNNYVDMKPGDFMIVYPEDPHAPLIGKGQIKKAIGKVKISV